MSGEVNEEVTLILPGVRQETEEARPTPVGELRIPAWEIPERSVSISPSLVAELRDMARDVARRAHAPYSDFHVGAALTMTDDSESRVFSGCNVENASYGGTICAERAALAAAAAAGFRRLELLVVSTIDSLGGSTEERSPCGICRQVIREFADEKTLVVLDHGAEGVLGEVLDIDRLLPWGFRFPGPQGMGE